MTCPCTTTSERLVGYMSGGSRRPTCRPTRLALPHYVTLFIGTIVIGKIDTIQIYIYMTLNGGSLGSWIDEERSKVR